jgi:hypothetical protein|tara:strand:- start:1304 stop:1444 length:141 start_codon:yes stop_codon:yes gene_type:complete
MTVVVILNFIWRLYVSLKNALLWTLGFHVRRDLWEVEVEVVGLSAG